MLQRARRARKQQMYVPAELNPEVNDAAPLDDGAFLFIFGISPIDFISF
jgi:hypothetical protein